MDSNSRSDFSACELLPSGATAGDGSWVSACFTGGVDAFPFGTVVGEDVVEVFADDAAARWVLITNFARSLA